MSQDKIFSKGIFFKKPTDKAPSFVLGKIKFKVEEAMAFLQEHSNEGGWATLDVKESKDGKIYCELDTYVPKNMTDSGQNSGASGSHPNEDEVPY
jgi:hypothetical protein